MKITTLIENTKNDSEKLTSEHGLCLHIEKDGKKILFDTGRTDNFIINANRLGISLKDVDVVVLSHGHGDHGGGLIPFFKVNNKAKVYMKKEAAGNFYFHYMFFSKSVRIDKNIFGKYSTRIRYINTFTEIMKDIYIITDINKEYPIPKGNKYLFVKDGGSLIRDKFQHELIMVIKQQEEICIFTGCSHNGVINMIQTSRSFFPNNHIKALIGGFHLLRIPIVKWISASQHEIDLIVKKIIDENIEQVYTGHCTGEKSYKKLKNILEDKIQYIKTGSEIYI